MTNDRLVGTWRLEDFQLTDAEGNPSRPWADRGAGLLIYSADGYMSAVITSPDGAGGMRTLCYCGPYDALEDRNVHHVEVSSDPALVGTDQTRLVTVEGDTMILRASPSIAGGPGSSADILWKRA